jgi:membrane dipeptidase
VIPIVDAHLDLALNAVSGFDVTASALDRRSQGQGEPTVGLPDLVAGGVAVAFATLWVAPRGKSLGDAVPGAVAHEEDFPTYGSPEEAHEHALAQLDVYQRWVAEGRVRMITARADLDTHLRQWESDRIPGIVLLMEGADPITSPDQVGDWWERGLRIVGPAWASTRYAAGTDHPGGLTELGRALLEEMARVGMALDLSHLAHDACHEALAYDGPLCVTHAHPRAFNQSDRHLADDVLDRLARLETVVGLTLFNVFLRATGENGQMTLDRWKEHAEYMASRIGWERVGIGSDLDGGFDRDETPVEIDSVADLRKIADLVPPAEREGVLGGNWLRWLKIALP